MDALTNKKELTRAEMAEQAASEANKRWGDGAVFRLGEGPDLKVDAISTGSIGLDMALGVLGVPRGRVSEIYGPESSGKTTVCQHIIAEAQRGGGQAAFIDVEHSLDPAYAERCGVNVKDLWISQPESGEQAMELAEAMIRSNGVDVVVVDSVAALAPRAEIEADMGDAHMAMQARLMSQALRKLSGVIKSSNTALIFTNQLRMKVGVVFGNPETTSGGMALKFYASTRIDVRRIGVHKDKDGVQTGIRVRARVVKNKVAPPFRQAEFSIMYNEGISKLTDLLDVGKALEIIETSGNWYVFGEEKLNGKDNARDYLKDNPDLVKELTEKILEAA